MGGFWARMFAAKPDFARPDADFGVAPASGDAPLVPGAPDLEEQLVASAERWDELRDGLETALHGPSDPLHPDLAGAGLGFVRSVLIRVLARVAASPGKSGDG